MRTRKLLGMGLWAFLMLGLYSMTAGGQTSCQLASGGQALVPVIVSANANASVVESAWELADYLGRITGGGFTVQVGDGATGIVVGMTNDFPALQSDQTLHLAQSFAASTDVLYTIQSYVLQSSASRVAVIGGSELGVEYAVWDLLYKLGYRKFFPGDAWEVIPSAPNAAVAVDVFEKPAYVDRRIWYGCGGDVVRQRDWIFRNRMIQASANMSFRQSMPAYLRTCLISAQENSGDIIWLNQDVFDAHPEYYALINGQRIGDKMCLSNTNVPPLALNAARIRFDETPDMYYHFSYSMEPSDGAGWCECANCVAIGSPTERAVFLANYVAKGLETTHPDKWVGILDYATHAGVPVTNVHPRVWVQCATAMSGDVPAPDRLQGWQSKGVRGGIYDYWGIAQWWGFLPGFGYSMDYLASSLPDFYSRGARIMCAESGDQWGPRGVFYYIASRILWNTNEASQVQALTDDFLVKSFGPASEAMRRFYTVIDPGEDAETGGSPGTADYQKTKYTQMYAALLWAADAAGADAAIQARLDDLFLYTRFVQLFDDWNRAGASEKQAALEQLILFSYRIRETCMGHWYGVLGLVPNADTVDLTPPPSCVTPALKAEARAAAVLVTANAPASEPVNGLLAHWMLDETSGITASDASGNGNTGTLLNGPVWTSAGKIAGALSFDGTNDCVDIAVDKLNPGCNSWSIALWFKTEDPWSWNTLYNKNGGTSGGYQAQIANGYYFYALTPDWVGGGAYFQVSAGQWQHAVMSFDRTNVYVYKNGSLVLTRAHPIEVGSSPNRLALGQVTTNDFSAPFKGLLDDVRIYNKALTAAEAAALANPTHTNHAPTAVTNAYTIAEDTVLTVAAPGVLGNDSDPDGDTLTATKAINPANGKYGADCGLVLNTNGSFTYTPRTNWNGTDTFTYKANDSWGGASRAVVTITVTPVTDLPVANAQNVTTVKDTATAITLTGVDPDGHSLTFAVVANPAHGGLSGTAPNLTYTPNTNWTGTDTFTFRVNNGVTNSSTVTVTIIVQPVISVTTVEACASEPGAGANGAFRISRAGSTNSLLSVKYALSGTAGNGVDYNALSGTVTIASNAAYADVPVVAKTDALVEPNETVILTLAANSAYAIDADNAAVTVTIADAGAELPTTNGLVAHWKFDETSGTTAADSTGNGNTGTLVNGPAWTIAGRVGGALSFDGVNDCVDIGDKLNPGTNSWTIALWLKTSDPWTWGTPYNKDGVYQSQLANGYFMYALWPVWYGGGIFTVSAGQWCHATVAYDKSNVRVYKNGVLAYTRAQTDDIGSNGYHLVLGALSYNGAGDPFNGLLDDVRMYNRSLTASEVATLAGISQVNSAPVAVNDTYTTSEDAVLTMAAPGVLSNDTDADEDTLTAAKMSDPANGALVFNADGSFTYTPTTNWNGSDSFTYRVSDGQTNSNTATVTLTVTSVNDAPTCSISSPANLATFTASASITINADAADIDGSISKVEFYNSATKLGEDTSSPYSFAWTNVAAGSYALTASATDNSGTVTTSAVVNITVYGPSNLTNGLVAYWKFDETSGTTASDSSGNGNTGTLLNGPVWTSSGRIGGALSFDGTNDCVDIGVGNLNPGSSSWSIALWFKTDDPWSWNTLYNKNGGSAGGYQAQVANGYLFYALTPDWAGCGGAYFPVSAGQWQHLVMSYDRNNIRIYKNGTLVLTHAQTDEIGSSSCRLALGQVTTNDFSAPFRGLLDDMRMYNRTLTAEEAVMLAAMVPSPWETQDIGAVSVGGNAAYSNGTFTVSGAGAGIGGTADQFRYVYQLASGDCEIKARVASVQNVNTWSKAGVMVRETLVDNARQALASVTAGSGILAQWRTSTGGSTSSNTTAGLTAPYWVRVVRTGSSFVEYRSTNGTTWVAMNTQSVSMATSVYIGLAVSSHVTNTACTAVIDNVTVTP